MLERLFKLQQNETNVRTEVLGGVTTFATMAYIVVVNPAILQFAGLPPGPSTVATIITAVFGCFLMAFFANRPFAVAPYMGENAFMAFGLASLAVTVTWQERLGSVFVAGTLFLILTLLRGRQWLVQAISPSLKHSFAVGIGLFLAFIGLYDTGIVTSGAAGMPPKALTAADGMLRAPDVPVKMGNLHDPKVLLAVFGFFVIAVLLHRKVKGALLIGIAVTAVLGMVFGLAKAPTGFMALPFQGEYTLAPVFLKLDIAGVMQLSMLPVVLTLLIMAFFDTTGTLVGLGASANLLDEKGDLPDVQKPMIVDAISCMFASLVGTSTSGVFIESASGIREGAKTGLSTLVVGLLFLVSLFFIPLFAPLQQLTFAYGPALIIVGLLMLPSIRLVNFDDYTELVPAFATIAMMVFTYNIANGLTIGLVLAPLMKVATGRIKEVNLGQVILFLLCLVYLVFGLRH